MFFKLRISTEKMTEKYKGIEKVLGLIRADLSNPVNLNKVNTLMARQEFCWSLKGGKKATIKPDAFLDFPGNIALGKKNNNSNTTSSNLLY